MILTYELIHFFSHNRKKIEKSKITKKNLFSKNKNKCFKMGNLIFFHWFRENLIFNTLLKIFKDVFQKINFFL